MEFSYLRKMHKNPQENTVAMSNLRTSDHKLMIEQGEEGKRPRIEKSFRTCSKCEGCIENECYFLVACAIYISRGIVFQKIIEKDHFLSWSRTMKINSCFLYFKRIKKPTKYWQPWKAHNTQRTLSISK